MVPRCAFFGFGVEGFWVLGLMDLLLPQLVMNSHLEGSSQGYCKGCHVFFLGFKVLGLWETCKLVVGRALNPKP